LGGLLLFYRQAGISLPPADQIERLLQTAKI
jgi:hypothetical protein